MIQGKRYWTKDTAETQWRSATFHPNLIGPRPGERGIIVDHDNVTSGGQGWLLFPGTSMPFPVRGFKQIGIIGPCLDDHPNPPK